MKRFDNHSSGPTRGYNIIHYLSSLLKGPQHYPPLYTLNSQQNRSVKKKSFHSFIYLFNFFGRVGRGEEMGGHFCHFSSSRTVSRFFFFFFWKRERERILQHTHTHTNLYVYFESAASWKIFNSFNVRGIQNCV